MSLPVVDEDRLNHIFSQLGEMDVKLDPDPLEFGPKRMNGMVAKTRAFLSRCERIYLQVSHDYQLYKRTHQSAALQFELQTQDLLANDPHVRAGRNLADRNALATMRMKAERESLIGMEITIQDLEMVLTVLKAKRADLRDIQSRLAQQQKLCEAELSLGLKWGSKPSPDTVAPDLDAGPLTDRSSLNQIQDILDGEVHLRLGDESWMAGDSEEGEEELSDSSELADDSKVDALLAEVAEALDDDPVPDRGSASVFDDEEDDDDDRPVTSFPQLGWCGVPNCGLTVHRTPSGMCCSAGHGAAPVLNQDPRLMTPKVETPKVETPKSKSKAKADVPAEPSSPAVEVDLDSLFDDDPPPAAPALSAVTTDADVDSLFSRMASEAPKAKAPPPVEEADIDSLIDMFTS